MILLLLEAHLIVLNLLSLPLSVVHLEDTVDLADGGALSREEFVAVHDVVSEGEVAVGVDGNVSAGLSRGHDLSLSGDCDLVDRQICLEICMDVISPYSQNFVLTKALYERMSDERII